MDNQVVVSDYTQMDRVLREERAYILNLVKQIKKAGCNVLLIQKSILRYKCQAPVPLYRKQFCLGKCFMEHVASDFDRQISSQSLRCKDFSSL